MTYFNSTIKHHEMLEVSVSLFLQHMMTMNRKQVRMIGHQHDYCALQIRGLF